MALKFDYNQTIAQAKQIDQVANDMQNNVSKKMNEICENMKAAWTGKAAVAYHKYITTLREDLLKKAKYLRDTADFLRTAAKKMKAADEAAKQSAQNI
ncbi:MAG: WXG100 family type VII secretion target [Deltaproteobacteria bacterium]|jgi:WXG100 family type VII secretion target|nr:WXG100 family type VII secretion target [Deltaproteobacteria bacterium]